MDPDRFFCFARETPLFYMGSNEISPPTRCACLAAGDMPGPGNGLHGSKCVNEHAGTRLLSHDEKPVRADGNAGVAWLLP
jgi:hypothetical protein